LKVYLRLAPPGRGFGLKVYFALLAVALVALIGWSEWKRSEIQADFETRSKAIWSAFTMLAAAESDYQNTQWNSEAHAAEAEATLKRALNSFGIMRSRIERDEWRRLAAVVANRFSVRRESQSQVVDFAFNEQMKVFRNAIERTDQLEQQYVAAELARVKGDLYFRLLLLAGIGSVFLLGYWRFSRSHRRSSFRRQRV